jgi:HD-like signal output (HDOD) protein/CheY-like chemotaxis protein
MAQDNKQQVDFAQVDNLIRGAYILAVDDFSSIRRIIVNTFRAREAYVDEASNGSMALDKMKMALENKSPYDIVFADVEMPVMDGIEFLRQLRKDKDMGDTPVVVLSSHSDSEEIRECISLKISDYVIKPPTRERLYQAMAKAMADRDKIRADKGLSVGPIAAREKGAAEKDYSKVIFKKLESIDRLPALPIVLERIKDLTHDPNANSERIAMIMKDEPSLMANVFKLANSVLYGARDPIDSLQGAITRLGLNAVNNMATSMAVLTVMNQKMEGFDHKAFCKHCISTGIAMCVLYEHCREKLHETYTKDLLHLAGLLHDIGKIIIIQFFHKEFLEAVDFGKKQAIPLFVAEQKTLGVDHSEVGAWLGRKWNLSSLQLASIRYHHSPLMTEVEHPDLVMLCHCANYICNLEKIGDGGDIMTPMFDQRVFDKIGLSLSSIPAILERVRSESRKSEILMSFLS